MVFACKRQVSSGVVGVCLGESFYIMLCSVGVLFLVRWPVLEICFL